MGKWLIADIMGPTLFNRTDPALDLAIIIDPSKLEALRAITRLVDEARNAAIAVTGVAYALEAKNTNGLSIPICARSIERIDHGVALPFTGKIPAACSL